MILLFSPNFINPLRNLGIIFFDVVIKNVSTFLIWNTIWFQIIMIKLILIYKETIFIIYFISKKSHRKPVQAYLEKLLQCKKYHKLLIEDSYNFD